MAPRMARHLLPVLAVIFVTLGLLFVAPQAVLAATYEVDTTSDNPALAACTAAAGDCSLRGAILTANTPVGVADTITFDAGVFGGGATVITLDPALGQLPAIADDLTIDASAVGGVTIDGDDGATANFRLFEINSGVSVIMDSLTLTDGNTGNFDDGGAILNNGTLSLNNATLNSNYAEGDGGGIYNTGILNITDSSLNSNTTTLGGAAIYNTGSFTISGSSFTNNQSGGDGRGSVISNAIAVALTPSSSITTSTFTNNQSDLDGGAIYNEITVGDTALTITYSTFSGNTAGVDGGAIANDAGRLQVYNSTFNGNTADDGGAFMVGGGTVVLVNSTLHANTSTGGEGGGGVYASGGTVYIANSTITANSAFIGGGIRVDGATVDVDHTIVAENTAANAPDLSGTFGDIVYSLIGVYDAGLAPATTFSNNLTGTVGTPLSPDLGALQNNGGPTDTRLPNLTSPVINAGNTTPFAVDLGDIDSDANTGETIELDQRGTVSRLQGARVDIGAVEVEIVLPPFLTIAKTVNNITTSTGAQTTVDADAGDVIEYVITISHDATNSGEDALNVLVTDELPLQINQNLTVVSATVGATDVSGQFSFTPDPGFILLANSTGITVPLGETLTITVRGTVVDSITPDATFDNIASVSWEDSSTSPFGPLSSSAVTVNVPQTFDLTKTVIDPSNGLVYIAQHVTYQLTLELIEGTSSKINISDVIPAGMTFEVGSATVDGTPVTPTFDGGNLTLTFPEFQAVIPGDNDTTNNTVVITYNLLVEDVGGNARGTVLTNTATAVLGTQFPTDSDSASVTVIEPQLTITKTATPDVGDLGDTITYTIEIQHSALSDSEAFGTLFEDTIPVGLTIDETSITSSVGTASYDSGTRVLSLSLGNLPDDATVYTISYDATIDNDPTLITTPPTSLDNTATVTYRSHPPNGVSPRVYDAQATESVTVEHDEITLTKTVALTTDVNGLGDFNPGDTIQYTLTYTNTGNTTLGGITLTDPIDANLSVTNTSIPPTATSPYTWNLGGLDVGGSGSITITATIDNPVAAGLTEICNQGTITWTGNTTGVLSDDPNDATSAVDPTCFDITAAPSVNAEKTITTAAATYAPGDTITYQVVITNTGNRDASGILFTDIPDANTSLTVGTVTTTAGTITTGNTAGDTTIEVNVGTLAGNGGSVTITYSVTVDSPLPIGVNGVCNQGDISGSNISTLVTDDPDTEPGDDPTCADINAAPDITAEKTITTTATTYFPGDTITYQVVITNNGDRDASEVLFNDTPDGNTTLVVGSVTATGGTITSGNTTGDTSVAVNIGTLAGGGGSVTITFNVTVNDPVPDGITQVCNQGSVGGGNFVTVLTDDPNEPDAQDATCAEVANPPGLFVAKAVSNGAGPFAPGQTIDYEVTIINVGGSDATGVTFTDTPDANTTLVAGSVTTTAGTVTTGNTAGDSSISVDIGTIGGGNGSVTITFSVTVNDPLPAGISVVCNQGTVSGTNVPSRLSDDVDNPATFSDATCADVTASPTVAAEKTITTGAGPYIPGDTISYQVVITNSGDQDAAAVTFSDTPDANTTLVAGSVTTTAGTITSGDTAGDTSVGVDVGTVAGAGGSVTITFSVTVDNPFPTGTTQVCNQGDVSGGNFTALLTDDPNDATSAADPTCADVTAAPVITAEKTITTAQATYAPGDTISYQVVVSNTGNQNANELFFNDTPGANTTLVAGSVTTTAGTITTGNTAGDTSVSLNLGTLAPNSSVTITFNVTVNNPFPTGTTQVCNQGTVSGSNITDVATDDPNDATSAADPTCADVNAAPVVTAEKTITSGAGPYNPGDTISYQVVITNSGNQDASGVTFIDTPGANTTLVTGPTVTTTAGTVTSGINANDTTVAVDVGTLAANGGSVTISFQVTVDNPLPAGVTEVCNQGVVNGTNLTQLLTDDPGVVGTADLTCAPVTAAPIVTAVKTITGGTPPFAPGQTITYTVVITNTGNQDASEVGFSDTPGTNTTLVTGPTVTTSSGTITSGSNSGDTTVGVNIGTLAGNGGSVTISFQATVDNPLPTGVTQVCNQGTVSGSNITNVLTDDPNDATSAADPTCADVTAAPVVTAIKTITSTPTTYAPGDTITYQVVVNNTGNQGAAKLLFTDAPDVNTTLTVGSVTTTAGTITSGNTAGDTSVTVAVGDLAANSSATITFSVTVNNPFPVGTTQVCNQGTVSADNITNVLTDDPNDATSAADPTCADINAAPVVTAVKTITSTPATYAPGDTISYQVVVSNTGNQNANEVFFNDTPDANTALVVGSVTTTAGTITSGNTAGDTSVTVAVGDLAPNNSVTITFSVTVNNPFPVSTSQVCNQGSVSADNISTVLTDDPNNATSVADPTCAIVTAAPVVTAVKTITSTPSTYVPGDTISYQVVVSNTGNQNAAEVFFNDTPDTNTTLVAGSVTTTAGTITSGNTAGDTSVSVNIGTLAPNTSVTITFSVTVNNPFPVGTTQVCNQGTVSGSNITNVLTDDPNNTTSAADPTCANVNAAPVIDAVKTITTSAPYEPGGTVGYQVVISNSGNQATSALVFNDLPDTETTLVAGSVTTTTGTITSGNTAGDTSVGIDIGTLAANSSVTITFNVTINNPVSDFITEICNQGVATVNNSADVFTDNPNTADVDDPTCATLTASPNVTMTKSITSGAGPYGPDDLISYQIVITNTGNQNDDMFDFTDDLSLDLDLVPGSVTTTAGTIDSGNDPGDIFVSISDLGVLPGGGGTITITYNATVTSVLDPTTTQVCNQAEGFLFISGDIVSDDPSTAAALDPTCAPVIVSPDVSATKSVTSTGPYTPGSTISYEVVITNDGDGEATNIVFTDTPDSNVTLVVGSVTSTFGTVITGNTPGDTSIRVELSSLFGGGDSDTIRFNVTVNDPIPTGVTQVCNQGTVSGGNFTQLVTDDPATTATVGDPTCTPLQVVVGQPIVSATKSVTSTGPYAAGSTISYQVVVSNTGTADATGVTFTDTPDANTSIVIGSVTTTAGTVISGNNAGDPIIGVDIGTLAPNNSVTITYSVTVNNPLPTGVAQVCNQGLVSGGNFTQLLTDDPSTTPANDPTCVTLQIVTGQPNVTATKIVTNGSNFVPGNTVSYEIVVSNTGTAEATGVIFTDTPDANTALTAGTVTTTSGTITSGNNAGDPSVGVNIGTLAANSSVTIRFNVAINNPFPQGVAQVCNQGTVSGGNFTQLVTDNPATVAAGDPTCVPVNTQTGAPVITAIKVAPNKGPFFEGDTVGYIVTITNTGTADATGVTFTDTPDANTTLVAGSVTTSAGTVFNGNNPGETTVGVNIGTLAANGGSVNITFNVTVNTPKPAGVTSASNQGIVTTTNSPQVVTDDPDTTAPLDPTIVQLAGNNLTIAKQFSPNVITVGETSLLRFTITNPPGSQTLTGLSFLDDLPVGLNFVSPAISPQCGGTVAIVSPVMLDFSGGSLPPGPFSCTIDVTVVATGDATGTLINLSSPVVAADGTRSPEGARAVITVNPPTGPGEPPPPPPGQPSTVFLCENLLARTGGSMYAEGLTDNVILNNVRGNVYCRIIALDDRYVTNAAEIGIQSVIDLGVIQSVDLFGLLPDGQPVVPFVNPVFLCMRGTGNIFFLDAQGASRIVTQLPTFIQGEYTCAMIPRSGTAVLVRGGTPMLGDPNARLGRIRVLETCDVTTKNRVNMREEPSLTSDIDTTLPYNITLTATAYVPGWYQVIYQDRQGWVAEQYLTTDGTCNQ